MNILGVRVDNLERKEILEKISCFLSEENPTPIFDENINSQDKKRENWSGTRFHQIATVNPEFILEAQEDKEFKNILNNCDLNIADSIGIRFAFWRLGEKLKCRMAGINLMQEILKIANEKKLKIFLAAKNGGLSSWEETALAIQKNYPDLEIGGAKVDVLEVELPNNASDIFFCNFGAPFQEKFLNGLKCDKIKLAVGVGGSFDYLTGKLKRAPKWMQFFGVEWFWRLLLQPKRIKRIWNAVIVFPIKIIFH